MLPYVTELFLLKCAKLNTILICSMYKTIFCFQKPKDKSRKGYYFDKVVNAINLLPFNIIRHKLLNLRN